MKRYLVLMQNLAHGYEYPPRALPFEAEDKGAAERLALAFDPMAEVLQVKEMSGLAIR